MVELKTETFDLKLIPLRDAGDYFDGEIRISCNTEKTTYSFATRSYFPVSDLTRLCAWIEDHIQTLLEQRTSEDRIWVPLDVSMEIQCQVGEVYPKNGSIAGGFSMLVLLNIGSDTYGRSVYGGFEVEVSIKSIRDFCTALSGMDVL